MPAPAPPHAPQSPAGGALFHRQGQIAAIGRRPRAGLLARAWAGLLALRALRRQRCALTRLDADLLRDLGLSAAQAEAEAQRPIWDVPRHWRL